MKKEFKIGDILPIKIKYADKGKATQNRRHAKIIRVYPRFVVLSLGNIETCVMRDDLVNDNWITV